MEAMKISKRFFAFGILACIAIYVAYIKWHLESKPVVAATEGFVERRGDKLNHPALTAGLAVFYGIMFDAGSTGTRIHIFKFTQQPKGMACFCSDTGYGANHFWFFSGDCLNKHASAPPRELAGGV